MPVLVGDDWKAALLWRALYDKGVFTNCALHPAVPPGGALLRTSVMATHDRPTLERALEVFATVKREFEAEHGPLPGLEADRLASDPRSENRISRSLERALRLAGTAKRLDRARRFFTRRNIFRKSPLLANVLREHG